MEEDAEEVEKGFEEQEEDVEMSVEEDERLARIIIGRQRKRRIRERQ